MKLTTYKSFVKLTKQNLQIHVKYESLRCLINIKFLTSRCLNSYIFCKKALELILELINTI